MRLYTFMHCYISQIQAGIQTSHVQGELANQVFKYENRKSIKQHEMIIDWSLNHKTIIVCNGGNSASLREFCSLFSSPENPYPWALFREDEDSMEGMMTGVGIILPEEIYNATSQMVGGIELGWATIDKRKIWVQNSGGITKWLSDPDDFTYKLIEKVKSAKLF